MKNKRLIALLVIMTMVLTLATGCKNDDKAKDSGVELSDMSTDIVIIGAGGGGLAAALEAKEAGKEVIIVEKMPMAGGNTLRATGGLNAAGTSSQEAMDIQDSVLTHYEDTMTGGYDKNDPELVKTMTDNAPGAVEWLIDLGADLSDVGRLGGATNNRAHRPTGGAPVGSHLVKVLKENVEKENIEILLETEAMEILYEDNKVAGIIAKDKDGNKFTIKAKAVIIASGGFGANAAMVTELDGSLDGFGTTNHPGATGDGIKLAEDVGADMIQMEEIQTHPTVVPTNGYMITEAVRGNGAIIINRQGKRFTNEIGTRDVVSEAILDQEGKTAFLFFDEGVRESLKAIDGYIDMGLTTEGNTLEEIAELLEIDGENLKATLESYNGYVDSSNDDDYERPDMPRRIEEAKYYTIEIGPAVHHTMGGIKINSNSQVLNENGDIIPGLFAAGEVTGGVHGGNRLGGNALADIIVFGRIAGSSSAEYVK